MTALRNFLKTNVTLLVAYFVLLATALFLIATIDRNALHLAVNRHVGNRYLNAFFYYITYLGDGRVAALVLAAITVVNVRMGLCATFAFLSAALVSNGLKYFFFDDVNRPFFIFSYIDKQDLNLVEGVDMYIHNSFPSGHATQGFAILMCLAFGAQRWWLKMFVLLLAVLTSFSRVYLSQHFMADIAAGSFIGFLAATSYYLSIVQRNRLSALDKPLSALRRK